MIASSAPLGTGADHLAAAVQHLLREQAGLDGLGQFHFVLRGQQRHLADLAEVDPDEVGGSRAAHPVGIVAPARLVGLLRAAVDDLHAVLGEHPHDVVDHLGHQLAAVERRVEVSHGDGTVLPRSRD